jgi:hypothetical protein
MRPIKEPWLNRIGGKILAYFPPLGWISSGGGSGFMELPVGELKEHR